MTQTDLTNEVSPLKYALPDLNAVKIIMISPVNVTHRVEICNKMVETKLLYLLYIIICATTIRNSCMFATTLPFQ